MRNQTLSPHLTLTRYIIIGMLLGLLTGWFFGREVAPLGVAGTLFIQLIKVLAVPLVFFTILDAIVSTSLSRNTIVRWAGIILVNSTCALVLGLALSNAVRPGEEFRHDIAQPERLASQGFSAMNLTGILSSLVPTSIVQPFLDNNVLSVVLLALLLGVATRVYAHSSSAELSVLQIEKTLRACASIVSILLLWLVRLAPVAVFCVTAKTVGESGFAPFKGLALYVAVATFGMLLQVLFVYSFWIFVVARVSVLKFLHAIHAPLAHAFGTNSSLATLPLTLQALDTLQVSKSSSRLGACIGTNFNNDGIVLYEAMAVLFVAQSLGIDLTLGQQIVAALVSLVAASGVAGVPEAGVVSLSLVLVAVGLPVEVVPMLLSVDWIVARVRSMTNVLSDVTVSIALDALTESGSQGRYSRSRS